MSVLNYIEKNRNIEINLLNFIEDEKPNYEKELSHFIKIVSTSSIFDQHDELLHFLQLLISVFENHHRNSQFISKFENILKEVILFNAKCFSNYEIFDIFRNNKRILLFLIKSKMITMDQKIFAEMIKSSDFLVYFQPEIKNFIDDKTNKVENDIISKFTSTQIDDDFDENREIGENENYLCKLIREDSVEEFIYYINKNNISINSRIPESLFESNLILAIIRPRLIEYASFYGSIQIFRYLMINNAELPPSLWIYSIHSQNSELIYLLEEKNIKPEDESYTECYKESIKCFHNDIADYIKYSLLKSDILKDRREFVDDQKMKEDDVEKLILKQNDFFLCPFQCHNYVFFPDDLNVLKFPLFLLYQLNYKTLVKLYFNNQEIDLSFTFNIDEYECIKKSFSSLGSFGYASLVKEKKTNKLFLIKNKSYYAYNIQELKILLENKYPALSNAIGYNPINFNFLYGNEITTLYNYYKNGSLLNYLKNKKREPVDTTDYIIILGLAIALRYLNKHEIDFFNFDLCNILLDDDLYPIISDFGLTLNTISYSSKSYLAISADSLIHYAPELLRNDDITNITHSYKIYTYSFIIYRILTRKLTIRDNYEWNGAFKVVNNIKRGNRPDLSNIQSKYIVDFIKKCWAQNPTERPDIEEVIDEVTNSDFYSYFESLNHDSVKKYLNIFGDEFIHLKNKF